MSWKSIVIAGLLCVLAAPAWAAPTIRVSDGGLAPASTHRVLNVFVTPDPALHSVDTGPPVGNDSSSMAVELGFSVAGSTIVSATSNSIWEDDLIAPIGNNGNNPFSASITEGIVIGGGGANVFAALGSSANASGLLQGETQVLSIELNSEIGVLTLTGVYNATGQTGGSLAVLAQAMQGFGVGGTFGIYGDFAGGGANGNVGNADFGEFAGLFGKPIASQSPLEMQIISQFLDVNDDGLVGNAEFGQFAGNFGFPLPPGAGGGSVAIPEPASAGILLVGTLIGLLRRKRR